MDIAERFWSRVNKTPTCWLWTGYLDRGGYGTIRVPGKRFKVHRFAYEMLASRIPEGYEIDHLCRIRHCVNPEHLEPVTRKENVLRGESPSAKAARQTHCIRGHELLPAGTLSQLPYRVCLQCKKIRNQQVKVYD